MKKMIKKNNKKSNEKINVCNKCYEERGICISADILSILLHLVQAKLEK
jgi:sulfur relay (sulfurtransferase) complex TusBCD TusD component (DsrE family)